MRRVAFCLALTIALVGCSLPTGDSPEVIAQDQLPESLQRTTTTTASTTLPGVPRDVTYFLLQEVEEQVQRELVAVELPIPDTNDLAKLIEPLFGDEITADRPGLINQVTLFTLIGIPPVEDGVAVIRLEIDEENPPVEGDLHDAAAQLVWTLDQFGGVESIRIEIGGELRSLPTDEGDSDDPVKTSDYSAYGIPQESADS